MPDAELGIFLMGFHLILISPLSGKCYYYDLFFFGEKLMPQRCRGNFLKARIKDREWILLQVYLAGSPDGSQHLLTDREASGTHLKLSLCYINTSPFWILKFALSSYLKAQGPIPQGSHLRLLSGMEWLSVSCSLVRVCPCFFVPGSTGRQGIL